MKRPSISFAVLTGLAVLAVPGLSRAEESWSQWGRDARHHGRVSVAGQPLDRLLVDLIYEPFVEQERAEQFGVLTPHYQVPLVDGQDVFMEWKTGTYISCDPPGWMTSEPCGVNTWNTQVWNERRLHWQNGRLVEKWNFASDWKPAPVPALNFLGPSEPVFHALLSGGHVYVPGGSGTLWKLAKGSGQVVARINPFGALDPHAYSVGPPTADSEGNVYYQVIQFAATAPFANDIRDAWLVRVRPNGSVRKVSFEALAEGAPDPQDDCKLEFTPEQLPWPPSPTAVPPVVHCGKQRPPVNAAAGIAPDGTIYVPSRAHRADRYSYLLAVRPNLTTKWVASFRGHLTDGCGTPTLPADAPGACAPGAPLGVDPATNEQPAGRAVDSGTNAPVIAPDGSVFFGTYGEYNGFRGKLWKFDRHGQFRGTFDYGLDVTPNLFPHDGTYSLILKENHYGFGTYCADPTWCAPNEEPAYYVTQVSANLVPEWRFQNTNTLSCTRNPDGTLSCVSDHPYGFEWCINASAVDKHGTVFANSEDGNLYAIRQGGIEKDRIFLQLALGAAYTPLSIGPDGKIYTQNAGHLFVVGR